ncbi:hypothetical protein [Paenibacillus sp. 1P03SA]|uniref:hypothetical protein n=1 Tax=Paenibacillus sp. 1P03SA TaxID=3132294 RepID=UPI0039A136BA
MFQIKDDKLSDNLEVITDEIHSLKKIAGRSIFEIGIRTLGPSANIKQIANHVAPMFGISPQQAVELMLSVKDGVYG